MNLMFSAYQATWPMCLGVLVFGLVVSALAYFVRIQRLDVRLNARALFWICLFSWFVFFSILLTLVDSPYLNLSHGTISMLFMLAAFLGIPMAIPLLAGTVWSLSFAMRGEPVRLGSFCLLSLGTFALGLATSNMHDVLYCGIITDGYTKHYPAGGDLAAFISLGNLFSIPEKITADYATLGPCAIILIAAELMIAFASLRRLTKSKPAQ